MKFNNLVIFIPAIKKSVIFQDDLIKKLNGISLIQRAINKAKSLTNNIKIITDSEEIKLISNRNSLETFYDPKLVWGENCLIKK